MACAVKSFEKISLKANLKNCYKEVCVLAFQHMTYTDIISAATKLKGEDGGEDENEEKEETRECISHGMVLVF
jgi:hypothetical protein